MTAYSYRAATAASCSSRPPPPSSSPVGMAGGSAPDASPLPDTVPLDESTTVFDTVYVPARTPLLRRAEASGARAISGLDLFLRQAAMQFLVWTGHEAPIDAFRASITERIGEGPDRT